jgi:WD40 repeat protein
MQYDALISYSHSADARLAPALELGLQRFGRPWYGQSRMRIFRDETNLAVSPALWSKIREALDTSRYFIFLASPAATASSWVEREIEYWLEARSAEMILIVLTDGEICWDAQTNDFDWSATTAIPRVLAGRFAEEPLYIDLRHARSSETITLAHPAFRDAVAELTATIRNIPKDRLLGEDVRHRRHAKQTAWSAMLVLALLAIVAFRQRNTAQERLAANLAEEARVRLVRGEIFAAQEHLRQVFELRPRDRVARVMAGVALRRAFALRPFLNPQAEPDPEANLEDPYDFWLPIVFADFTSDSRRLVIVGGTGADVFDVTTSPARKVSNFDMGTQDFDQERNASLDPVHPRVALIGQGRVVVWDFAANRATRPRFAEGKAHQVGFNADGSILAVAFANVVVLRSGLAETRIPGATKFVWHPNGREILTGDGLLRDAVRPERVLGVLERAAETEWLEFSPMGDRIVGAGTKGLLLWRSAGGPPAAELRDESFHSAHFSHDGTRIVALGERNLIVSAGIPEPIPQSPPPDREELPSLEVVGTIRADDGAVTDAIIDPTDSYVITAGLPAAARVWSGVSGEPVADVARSDEDIYVNEPYGSSIVRLAPNGTLLLSVGDYRTIARARLWTRSKELVARFSGTKARYSRDGKWLFTVNHGLVEVRDAATLRRAARWRGNDYENITPEEIAVVDGARISIRHLETWEERATIVMPNEIERLSITADGERALVFSAEGMHVVNLYTAHVQCGMEVLGGRDAAWTTDGSRIIVVGNDAQVWRAADCKLQQQLEHEDDAFLIDSVSVLNADRAALFSSTVTNGTGEMYRFIDIVSLDPLKKVDEFDTSGFGIGQALVGDGVVADVDRRQATIIDVATGNPRVRLDGQSSWITSVEMTSDGALIATGDAAQSVKLWTAAGKRIATFEGHAADITHVQFDPGRERLLSEAEDGSIRIWDIAGVNASASNTTTTASSR